MTVVAAYSHDGYVYLCGDLLLSDSRIDKNSIELPASGFNPNLKVDGSRLAYLRQKIVVIASYCALGFAGDFENARALFETLKAKASLPLRLSYGEVSAEIASASKAAADGGHPIAIVGWYQEEDGLCKTLRANATLREYASGHILVAGSGSDLFLDTFENVVNESARVTTPLAGFDPRVHWLFLQSSLIGMEGHFRQDAPSLSKLFGGGYELIAQWKDGFRKTEDVTVVLWQAFCSFKGRPKYKYNAFLAYKMSYVRDTLVIRVCSTAGKEWDGYAFSARNAAFVALPPYFDPQQPYPDETESVQLDSQAVCHVVHVTVEDEMLGFFLDVDFGSQKGSCKNVKFTYPRSNGTRSFDCEISEVRKLSFKEGILDLVKGHPSKPFPA